MYCTDLGSLMYRTHEIVLTMRTLAQMYAAAVSRGTSAVGEAILLSQFHYSVHEWKTLELFVSELRRAKLVGKFVGYAQPDLSADMDCNLDTTIEEPQDVKEVLDELCPEDTQG